jgi:hypothetical protein
MQQLLGQQLLRRALIIPVVGALDPVFTIRSPSAGEATCTKPSTSQRHAERRSSLPATDAS